MQKTAVRRVSQDNLNASGRVGGKDARTVTPTKRGVASGTRSSVGSSPPGMTPSAAAGLKPSWTTTKDTSKYHNGDGFVASSSVARPGGKDRAGNAAITKRVNAPAPEDKPILVLDMDETLIHTVFHPSGHRVIHRPGLYAFLDAMVKSYQLVVFTAGLPQYADVVLDEIDPTGRYFAARHYRHSCKVMNGIYCKDLRNIRKSLKNIMIIDNIPQNYMLQSDLGIPIEDFLGDSSDTALTDLIPLLAAYPSSKMDTASYLKKHLKTCRHVLQEGFYHP